MTSIAGRSVYGNARDIMYSSVPVADALYKRLYLVELIYSHERFVVAISDIECEGKQVFSVTTPDAAGRLARMRAEAASDTLGYLISVRVKPDCSEAREMWGVSGPKDAVTYDPLWH